MDNKINVKDLINVGIFTALYFVTYFAVGCIGYIPIFMVFLPFVATIVTGIPFMLYLTKVNKFGMITITGIIVALGMFATGHGWPMLLIGISTGVISDLIFKSGKYKSWGKTVAGYIVFSLWCIGAMLPMWVMRDEYFSTMREGYGDTYTDTLMNLMSGWMLLVLIVSAIIGATLGAFLGRKVLNKHFKRAGIA